MSNVTFKPAGAALPNADIERLRSRGEETLASAKDRLRRVTREFESFFTHSMLKAMRKTVPETGLAEGAPLNASSGKDIYTDMFDMELARNITSGNANSISDMLYRSMEGLVEAQYGERSGEVEMKSLNPAQERPLVLDADGFTSVSQSGRVFSITPVARRPMQIGRRALSAGDSNILEQYGEHIYASAREVKLDPALLVAVIKTESAGDPKAVSHKGAKGLMQLADSTAADYKVTDVFDPGQNIRAGSQYLKDLQDRFGDLKLALAAYNAGPGNVKKYNGIPPFEETKQYVGKVIDTMRALRDARTGNEAKVR